MKFRLIVVLAAVLFMGCAARAWPPAISIGQAQQCDSVLVEYDIEGRVTRVTYDDCLTGGALTEQGAKTLTSLLALPRTALMAVLGAP